MRTDVSLTVILINGRPQCCAHTFQIPTCAYDIATLTDVSELKPMTYNNCCNWDGKLV